MTAKVKWIKESIAKAKTESEIKYAYQRGFEDGQAEATKRLMNDANRKAVAVDAIKAAAQGMDACAHALIAALKSQ